MKKFYLLLIVAFISGLNLFAQECSITKDYIMLSVYCQEEIIPDEIHLTISIDEAILKGKATVKELEHKMVKELEKLNIDYKSALSAVNFSSDIKSQLFKKSTTKNRFYSLKLSTVAQASDVIANLNKIGISNISLSKIDISKELFKKYSDELLARTTSRAIEKIDIIADAAKIKVGDIINIEHSSSDYYSGNIRIRGYVTAKSYDEDSAMPNSVDDIQMEPVIINCSVKVKRAILSSKNLR